MPDITQCRGVVFVPKIYDFAALKPTPQAHQHQIITRQAGANVSTRPLCCQQGGDYDEAMGAANQVLAGNHPVTIAVTSLSVTAGISSGIKNLTHASQVYHCLDQDINTWKLQHPLSAPPSLPAPPQPSTPMANKAVRLRQRNLQANIEIKQFCQQLQRFIYWVPGWLTVVSSSCLMAALLCTAPWMVIVANGLLANYCIAHAIRYAGWEAQWVHRPWASPKLERCLEAHPADNVSARLQAGKKVYTQLQKERQVIFWANVALFAVYAAMAIGCMLAQTMLGPGLTILFGVGIAISSLLTVLSNNIWIPAAFVSPNQGELYTHAMGSKAMMLLRLENMVTQRKALYKYQYNELIKKQWFEFLLRRGAQLAIRALAAFISLLWLTGCADWLTHGGDAVMQGLYRKLPQQVLQRHLKTITKTLLDEHHALLQAWCQLANVQGDHIAEQWALVETEHQQEIARYVNGWQNENDVGHLQTVLQTLGLLDSKHEHGGEICHRSHQIDAAMLIYQLLHEAPMRLSEEKTALADQLVARLRDKARAKQQAAVVAN